MHKFCKYFALLLILCVFPATSARADITLPAPQQEGGMGLFEALKKRASVAGGDFSLAEVSLNELSTILWAATGLNRGSTGWTVPMAMGKAPYCKIYVAGSGGVWLYDWVNHSLKDVSAENIKAKIGRQGFVKKAAYVLIIVADGEALEAFKDNAVIFRSMAAGAMGQNIYLAAAALKIGARYIYSMQQDEIIQALRLPAGDAPLCLMLLGK